MDAGELEFVSWVKKRPGLTKGVLLGPGDDAAALDWKNGRPCLATTDMLMEGTDFHLAQAGAFRVGRKAMNVNLSDLAAMAAIPRGALASVALPKKGGQNLARELFFGIESAAKEFDCPIVGGDTNSWDGPLVISITLLGEPGPSGIIKRSGAKTGDALLVTGPLGGSIGGKHLDFKPRVREALELAKLVTLNAAIDISDGLALDLGRLCDESKKGARLWANAIPLAAEVAISKDGKAPLEHALGDGEDFELLFAVSKQDAQALLRDQPIKGITLYHVGEVLEQGLYLEENGKDKPLPAFGYSHTLD